MCRPFTGDSSFHPAVFTGHDSVKSSIQDICGVKRSVMHVVRPYGLWNATSNPPLLFSAACWSSQYNPIRTLSVQPATATWPSLHNTLSWWRSCNQLQCLLNTYFTRPGTLRTTVCSRCLCICARTLMQQTVCCSRIPPTCSQWSLCFLFWHP